MNYLVPPKQDAEYLRVLKDAGFSDEGLNAFTDYAFEQHFWEQIEKEPTPPEITEEFEGYKDKNGNPVLLEYHPEEYVLEELRRLFPGWWTEKIRRSSWEEVVNLQTTLVEGYLMCPYVTPSGTKVKKIWGIAGNDILFKKDTKIPLDIANAFKGARTEWIRICAKWLGIGLDIYHQKITPELRRVFEDRIRIWRPYAEYWITAASNAKTGKTFRAILKAMPKLEQIKRFSTVIKLFPETDQNILWKKFAAQTNVPSDREKEFETFLNKVEIAAQRFSTESKQK